ncbi:MAG: LPS export ABC transporter periplasmic protein LptC [Rhodospirillales bacterium]|nr:LPS export ABC transporter periplasmic protein LptC [Rhodospirillales bacterium]
MNSLSGKFQPTVGGAGAAHKIRASRLPRRFTQSYSRFVAMMKFLLPVAALVLIAMVVLWPHIGADDLRFRIGFAAIKASVSKEPSMVNPRFVGTDSENKPYSITADLARSLGDLSDKDVPTNIELEMPKADITLEDGSWLVLTARTGLLANQDKALNLEGAVNLFHDSGYEFRTEKAAINLATGVASGNLPIEGQGPFGVLKAEGFKLIEKGKTIYFSGKSKLVLHPGAGKTDK